NRETFHVSREESLAPPAAHRFRSLPFVILSQVDDDTLTPYRLGRDCCVQGGEGSTVTPPRVGSPQVGACRDCYPVLSPDRSPTFECRLSPHSRTRSKGGCTATA